MRNPDRSSSYSSSQRATKPKDSATLRGRRTFGRWRERHPELRPQERKILTAHPEAAVKAAVKAAVRADLKAILRAAAKAAGQGCRSLRRRIHLPSERHSRASS